MSTTTFPLDNFFFPIILCRLLIGRRSHNTLKWFLLVSSRNLNKLGEDLFCPLYRRQRINNMWSVDKAANEPEWHANKQNEAASRSRRAWDRTWFKRNKQFRLNSSKTISSRHCISNCSKCVVPFQATHILYGCVYTYGTYEIIFQASLLKMPNCATQNKNNGVHLNHAVDIQPWMRRFVRRAACSRTNTFHLPAKVIPLATRMQGMFPSVKSHTFSYCRWWDRFFGLCCVTGLGAHRWIFRIVSPVRVQ